MTPRDAQRDPRIVAIIVASALFMQNLDSAVVATVLPSMARDLGVLPVHLSVAITSYLVSLCVFIPVSSWVADRFGARRVFMVAIVIFVLASASVGLSQGLEALVASRIVQGMGGAMMVPVGRLLLLRRIRKEELITAMTWLTMPGLLGPVLGPPVGGLLTDAVSWRAVFWLNIPVGVIGLALVWRFIPDVEPQDPGPLDAKGLTLWGVALALLMAGLETVGRPIAPRWFAPVMLAAGLLTVLLAVRHSRRIARPAVDLSLLKLDGFGMVMAGGSFFRIGASALPFLLPLMLQLTFGYSASGSGMVTFATALGAFGMKPLVRPTLRRFGFRGVLAVNGVLAALLLAACAAFTPAWPVWLIFAVLAVGGVTRALQFTSMATLSFADVPQEKLAPATAMSGTMQQLGQALGVVLGSLSLEFALLITGAARPGVHEFTIGFLIAAAVMLLSIPSILRLPRDVGASVSGHHGGA